MKEERSESYRALRYEAFKNQMKTSPLKRKTNWLKTYKPLQRKSFLRIPQKKISDVDNEIWTSSEADKKFSLFIRKRDGKCLNCFTRFNLTCSHYYGRSHWATRYCPLNCITLCINCHTEWEHKKKNVYLDFMKTILGNMFLLLEEKSTIRMRQQVAIVECMSWLQKVEEVSEIKY